jgi:hypothetical protein
MEYINPILLLIIISEVCFYLCARVSPQFLRRVAAHLLTRADAVEASRKESERRKQFWTDQLGLAREGVVSPAESAN